MRSRSSASQPLSPLTWRGCLWAVLCLGFLLRLRDLVAQSLWLDEAMSLFWASLPADEIIGRLMSLSGDPHPPLYYLLLKAWTAVLGDGDFAVRSLSVAAGVASLVLLYILGRRLFDRRVALLAVLLAAISPLLIWYAQEARMYSLLLALTLTASWYLLNALEGDRRRDWALYAVFALAGAYTHLYGALLLPFQGIFALWVWANGAAADARLAADAGGQDRPARVPRLASRARRGLAAFAAVAVGYAPWAWAAWQSSGSAYSGRPALGLAEMLGGLLTAFTVHRGQLPAAALVALVVVLAAGFVLDAAHGARSDKAGAAPSEGGAEAEPGAGTVRRHRWLFLGLYLLGPLLLVALLSRRYELWGVPYLTVLAPPFLLALAAAVQALARRWRPLGVAALALVLSLSAIGLYANAAPENRREDWRAAAAYVNAHAVVDDAVLVVADFARAPFAHYYRGAAPVYAPWGGRINAAQQVELPLQGLTGGNTIWLVQSHQESIDPEGLIPRLLEQRYPIVTEQFPKGVRVAGYAVRTRLSGLPAGATASAAGFGPLRLLGFAVDAGPHHAADETYHPPSGWVHVSLYWQAQATPDQDYSVAVRLVDGIGQVWGDRLERPAAPLRRYPPSRWAAGEVVRDEYDVNLNPVTPAGRYRVEVAVSAADGRAVAKGIITEVDISP